MNIDFKKEVKENINRNKHNIKGKNLSLEWISNIDKKYSYNFTWLGRPIIQYPQDILAMQELIWEVKPDLIIETGIAHGGSCVFHASMLEIIGKGEVLAIDIDIREHNKVEIEKHPMYKRITMLEGSSISDDIVKQVHDFAKDYQTILVCLDSNHTHDHVLSEMNAYSSLVSKGSYMVVFDTIIEDLPQGSFPDRPWDKGDNPKTAVWEFLKTHDDFEIQSDIDDKLLISVAPSGYLKKIK